MPPVNMNPNFLHNILMYNKYCVHRTKVILFDYAFVIIVNSSTRMI